MEFDLPPLPIHSVLPELRRHLTNHSAVVLAAEPGSGKTTIIPLSLLNEPWLAEKKIIMLEPRRLAARMAAQRMSTLANDKLGRLVGFRIRFAKKISSATRIEVVTEGILTRMIQNDPELTGVGVVIFDEFHERSIHADLALAFCLDAQKIRTDLKIIIMSATMDTTRISKLLNDAPVVTGQGRCYPVAIKYLPRPATDFLIQRVTKAIKQALLDQKGDILVFLPGAGEINAIQNRISGDFICLPLHGSMPQNKQDLIFTPTDKRRLILATPIAETSLTIEGVSIVIDSGLVKIPRFSPATSLTTLETTSISAASAEQRAGRAGRLAPGICYRLWTEAEQHSKAAFQPPEIVNADLAPLLLEVLQWGVKDPSVLDWLDPPRQGQIDKAQELLTRLGVLDARGNITTIGRQISKLPMHPRLALMVLRGNERGQAEVACRLAALLRNRDLFLGNKNSSGTTTIVCESTDIEDRLNVLRLFEQQEPTQVQAHSADPSLCRRILQEAKQYRHLLNKGEKEITGMDIDIGSLLAISYPDRIAQKKQGASQHLLSSGRGVHLPTSDHLQYADFLVAANVDGGKKTGRIFLAAALSRQEIITNHAHLLSRKEKVEWHQNRIEAVSVLSLGSLELAREPVAEVDPAKISKCLIEGIKQTGIHCLGWHKKSRELQARMQSAHIWNQEKWPDVSDTRLVHDFAWLTPYLDSLTTLKQVRRLDLYTILLNLLTWQDQQEFKRLLPDNYQVASGSKIKLQYKVGESPILAVRIQQMFGTTMTPTVFNGQIAVVIHLLSPAGRPIQVTSDIVSFWKNTYGEVKKELKGRYPKHFWPDNPLTAQPTNRVKPRKM